MSVQDKQIGRLLQREVSRRQSLDTSDIRIIVQRGVGYITGVIRPAPGCFVDPKEETKALLDVGRRIPDLRDLVIEAKWEIASKK